MVANVRIRARPAGSGGTQLAAGRSGGGGIWRCVVAADRAGGGGNPLRSTPFWPDLAGLTPSDGGRRGSGRAGGGEEAVAGKRQSRRRLRGRRSWPRVRPGAGGAAGRVGRRRLKRGDGWEAASRAPLRMAMAGRGGSGPPEGGSGVGQARGGGGTAELAATSAAAMAREHGATVTVATAWSS
ncbi:hypothetical protein OsJ_30684 [Oryza sativa Japonica Group]|uniref:Uncharacterized protein n=1 Tax=Oryza sativa subsp. japonica TaxID=39947 RepID=A3C2F4_ORYSJ|nr:hypothetical protein OsJ_30684 [Oryza sativa Japonica Group]